MFSSYSPDDAKKYKMTEQIDDFVFRQIVGFLSKEGIRVYNLQNIKWSRLYRRFYLSAFLPNSLEGITEDIGLPYQNTTVLIFKIFLDQTYCFH